MIRDAVLILIGIAVGQIPTVAAWVKSKFAKAAPVVAKVEAEVKAKV